MTTDDKTKTVTMTLELDKVTPNAVRYAEAKSADNPNPKNMYFQKSEMAQLGNPDKLIVTIAAA
jgi:hypothetical protein